MKELIIRLSLENVKTFQEASNMLHEIANNLNEQQGTVKEALDVKREFLSWDCLSAPGRKWSVICAAEELS